MHSGCQELLNQIQEMSDYIYRLTQDYERCLKENYCMSEYIRYRNLSGDFRYFSEHAREVSDENSPFPYLTL